MPLALQAFGDKLELLDNFMLVLEKKSYTVDAGVI